LNFKKYPYFKPFFSFPYISGYPLILLVKRPKSIAYPHTEIFDFLFGIFQNLYYSKPMDLLKNLNDKQKEAVTCTDGPLLIIAGAGAGKTRVITYRAAYLIQKGVAPDKILAVTFTNKAAEEMKNRILRLRPSTSSGLRSGQVQKNTSPTIGTFHAICARILRENARAAHRTRNFSILDEEDSLKNIKSSLKKLELNPKQFQPKKIKNAISKNKSDLINLDDYKEKAGNDFFPKTLSLIWEEYEKNLKKSDAFDFDDLISETVYLFLKKREILKKYQNKWHYIMVDEYQDTNHSQYIFTKLLAQKKGNICVVGDEDQSIYSWRGANFENIFKFEYDWPKTKIVMLEQNYRSTQKILKAANKVISKNKLRKPKNLFSQIKKGENISIFPGIDEKEEAQFIAESSKKLLKKGVKPKEIAVLYRANFQSRILEELFISYNLPYQIMGVKFFERKEIKDIVCYIKAALNRQDILSLKRIINEPSRGIGKTTLMQALSGYTNKITPQRKKKLSDFFNLLNAVKKNVETRPVSETISFVIEKSMYKKQLSQNKNEESMMRLDNLKELVALSKRYDPLDPLEGILKFLEDVALMTDQDTVKDKTKAIRLMTVHAAKGLEFENVFISGLEEGLFPYPDFSEQKDPEEERRLFYVALTRAKEKLFLSFAMSRMIFGGNQVNRPSKFLDDIPEELLEEVVEENLKNIQYE